MITVRVDPIPPVFEQTIYNSIVPEVTGTVSVIHFSEIFSYYYLLCTYVSQAPVTLITVRANGSGGTVMYTVSSCKSFILFLLLC